MDSTHVTRSLRPHLSFVVGGLLVAVVQVGCTSSGQRRPAPPLADRSTDAATLKERPAAGHPGAAPATRPGSVDPVALAEANKQRRAKARARAAARARAGDPPPLSQATFERYKPYAATLRNAARRDRAMERTMRTYMLITREVFRRLRGPQASGTKRGAAAYNPVPAWRFQARARREFRDLADRAGVIEHHLQALQRADVAEAARATGTSAALATPIDITVDAPGRHGRLSLYRRIFRCIRADTWHRAAHGQAWVDRMLASSAPAGTQLDFSETARVRLYQQELQMMRMSVRCSTLIAQRRARN